VAAEKQRAKEQVTISIVAAQEEPAFAFSRRPADERQRSKKKPQQSGNCRLGGGVATPESNESGCILQGETCRKLRVQVEDYFHSGIAAPAHRPKPGDMV
jgi:hypothetical protein